MSKNCRTRKAISDAQSSTSSKISSVEMASILEELEFRAGNRDNTVATYRRVWKSFNRFLIKLDKIPRDWEDRTGLFVANLITNGAQSATVKSYVSAIKFQLKAVRYH